MTMHPRLLSDAATEFRRPAPEKTGRGSAGAEREDARMANRLYRGGLKRGLDLVLLLVTLPITLPLLFAAALLVACDGAMPFYRQSRVGRGGRRFHMVKLRSMVPDADAQLEAHLAADPAARAEWDYAQKLQDDPRITPVGRRLRKCSLDELPQLWNVFLGQMSLVGPRPMMEEQQAFYPGTAYYALRPGLTGPWQVAERNRTSFADRARYDSEYEAALSLRTDLALLVRTGLVVVKGTGC